jgi:hypothetical protein
MLDYMIYLTLYYKNTTGMSHLKSHIKLQTLTLIWDILLCSSIVGPVSSWTRQHFALYQVQSSSNRHVILLCCVLILPKLVSSSGFFFFCFEFWRSEVSWKINLDRTVWTYKNNLDSKRLIHVIDWFPTLPLRGSFCSHYPLHKILSVYHVFSLINLVSLLSI